MAIDIEAFVGRELDTYDLWLFDKASGDLFDYSVGYTFTVAIRQNGTDTTLSNAVVTAYANPSGDGTDDADVPTLNVAPAAGELDGYSSGRAKLIIVATSGAKDREHQFEMLFST